MDEEVKCTPDEKPQPPKDVMVSARFCNEVCLGIKNGMENNVKSIKDYLVNIFIDAIVILPQKDVEKRIIVPFSNVASYWLVD